MTRALLASALAVVLGAACSATSKPPQHAGIVIVTAVFASGPSGPGVNPVKGPIAHTTVTLRAANGAVTTAITDDRGKARFVVARGVYVARLADVIGFEGSGGTLDCGGGAYPATTRVLRDGTSRVSLACNGVG